MSLHKESIACNRITGSLKNDEDDINNNDDNNNNNNNNNNKIIIIIIVIIIIIIMVFDIIINSNKFSIVFDGPIRSNKRKPNFRKIKNIYRL